MSTSDAERYARRARNSSTAQEVGDNAKRAIDALIEAINKLESRVKRLERDAR
jgi:hypothetical protein